MDHALQHRALCDISSEVFQGECASRNRGMGRGPFQHFLADFATLTCRPARRIMAPAGVRMTLHVTC